MYLFRLWSLLTQIGSRNAALGLVYDMFQQLDRIDAGAVEDDEENDVRETLMRIVGDDDGRDLQAWRDRFHDVTSDFHERIDAFVREAREASDDGCEQDDEVDWSDSSTEWSE